MLVLLAFLTLAAWMLAALPLAPRRQLQRVPVRATRRLPRQER